ncbi:MAG: sulfotransferase family protein [Brevundimonas sp.]
MVDHARTEDTERRLAAIDRVLDRPVFIAGRGRSGTSLLSRLFDGHPQLFCAPGESRVFTEIAPRLKADRDPAAAATALADRFPLPGRPPDPGLQAQVAALDPHDPALPRALFRLGLERWSRTVDPGDAGAFLEKTPKTEDHLPAVFAAFPQARILYAIRDPRGVYVSNRRSPDFRQEPAVIARQWVKSVSRVTAHLAHADGPVRLVRFETLVREPRVTLERLCRFLELDWSDSLLAPTVRGAPWAGNAYDPSKLTPDGVAERKAEEWRAEITPQEMREIAAVAGAQMEALGYPV